MSTNGYCYHKAGHTVTREVFLVTKSKEGGREGRKKKGRGGESLSE